ncbi:hypothetical protein AD998_11565 [bacterium 336/3]|jgi:hypothetical protein|nr:hypothetical protein AD998_11565 [bacterium 336/3]
MSSKKLKFSTILEYILTVLITKLVYDFLMYVLPVIQSTKNPYYDVLIGMGLTIIVFYPVYGFIHTIVEKVSKMVIKADGRKKTTQYIEMTVGFLVIVALVFAGLMKIKREINVFQEIFKLF